MADIDTIEEVELPEHSPLGASSAERWMNCAGSVELVNQLRAGSDYDETDPDYRRDGTQAHELAAHCLQSDIDCWQADETLFPELTADMMGAVQEYLDFVRLLPGRMFVEQRVHLPKFHKLFYGTLDCGKSHRSGLHIVDYKHGVGVVVDAEDNPQLMYYGYGFIKKHCPRAKREWKVKLTIVQPRAYHPDGTIRTWETTVGHITDWAENELRPAMDATADMDYLSLGPWCRFCPAKLACAAYDGLKAKAVRFPEQITYAEAQQLKMLIKAKEDDTLRRLLAGGSAEELGAKLVHKRADRAWKENAPVVRTFGDDAWCPRELRSPAQVEKLPQGKDFVAEFAFKPETGYTVALLDDKRAGVTLKTGAETFAAYATNNS